MKIINSKIIARLLIITMFLMVFSPVVFAEKLPGFELPVTVELSGTPPTDDEDYRIVIEADNPNYPMPEGSENSRYTLIITGEDRVRFPRMEFSSLGIYTYTIYQLSGSNSLATYDDTRYDLVVYVTNAPDGSGLETTVLLYLLGEENKLDEVLFGNEYDAVPIIPPPPTPPPPIPPTPTPPGGSTPPTPVIPDNPVPFDETIEIDEDIPEDIPDFEVSDDETEDIDEPIPLDSPDPPSTDGPDVPKTGDDTAILPYIGLFISGAALLVILGFTIKKNEIE